MMKQLLIFLLIILASCKVDERSNSQCKCSDNFLLQESSIIHVDTFETSNVYDKELSLLSYLPDSMKLKGMPNSYVESISSFPNYSKAEYEQILHDTDGLLSVDTTDRDFDKYWYDDNGSLCKYAQRDFGDMRNIEVYFNYNIDMLIEDVLIIDVVAEDIKYKRKLIMIDTSERLIVERFNVIEDIR